MTKLHNIGYYVDGRVNVAYCMRCSAEGQKLLEDCPQKISTDDKNTLDEKKPDAK